MNEVLGISDFFSIHPKRGGKKDIDPYSLKEFVPSVIKYCGN